MVKVTDKHHYELHITFCPVCGKENSERVRCKGASLGNGMTWHINEVYDYCLEV